ncbi:MAG: hypothetical protein KDJ34_18385, partial [Candidatus Competibacteraceae bacterium]|nr:hypothetical protein [Candidatus Competibacteraceae bacterium]
NSPANILFLDSGNSALVVWPVHRFCSEVTEDFAYSTTGSMSWTAGASVDSLLSTYFYTHLAGTLVPANWYYISGLVSVLLYPL